MNLSEFCPLESDQSRLIPQLRPYSCHGGVSTGKIGGWQMGVGRCQMGKMAILSGFSRKWLIFSVLQPNFKPKISKVKPPISRISVPTSKFKASTLKVKPPTWAIKDSTSLVSAPTSKISASTSGNSHLMPPLELSQLGINPSSQLAPRQPSAAFVRANWLAHLPLAAQIGCCMSSPDDIPKLRMVPPESPEEIARHRKQNYFQYPC